LTMQQHAPIVQATGRMPFIDALRAVVSTLVAWHHIVLYGTQLDVEFSLSSELIDLLRNHRSIVQVFFVVSGFLMAGGMSRHAWDAVRVCRFVVRRYLRLGLPYLAAIGMALFACAWGRGCLPVSIVGQSPTSPQILAHVVFLQDILGYESLSAGLWFVCIEIQLALVYAVMLYLRDRTGPLVGRAPGEASTGVLLGLGYLMAIPSLFYFNLNSRFDSWWVYFFGQFFLGVVIHYGLQSRRLRAYMIFYVSTILVALAFYWRWRLATSLMTGMIVFGAGQTGLLWRWPTGRFVAYLGRTAYSLFLVHFPVMVLVFTLAAQAGWISSERQALIAFALAYFASLGVASLFFRLVELPAISLSRRWS